MTTPAPRKKLTTSAMIASFADPGQRTTSAPFGHALAELAQERPEIVGLSADLAKYTDMHVFRDAHPDRFFQMGMAEQSLLGTAAGLAEVGLVPFASTYSVFATRRAYDFLCLDIAEPGLNVNVVGALPGLTTGYGPSHQATEDLAILRGCPNLTIVDVNALQADGPTAGVLRTEPVLDKWRAFGWHALRVDGNDVPALVAAFDELREHRGSPSVLICDTRIGRGVPLLETREKAHFMRVAEHEWQIARDQLQEGMTR